VGELGEKWSECPESEAELFPDDYLQGGWVSVLNGEGKCKAPAGGLGVRAGLKTRRRHSARGQTAGAHITVTKSLMTDSRVGRRAKGFD